MSAAGESWGTGREADPLDREERDEDEQAWQAWVESPEDPDSWLSGWVVYNHLHNYVAGSNLATPLDEPLDPVTVRMLEDWSGWMEGSPDSGKRSSDGEEQQHCGLTVKPK